MKLGRIFAATAALALAGAPAAIASAAPAPAMLTAGELQGASAQDDDDTAGVSGALIGVAGIAIIVGAFLLASDGDTTSSPN